jgi:hypothetical protein
MDFRELFGSETPATQETKTLPALPWESTDPRELISWMKPPSQQSATACAQIENIALLEKICGEVPQPTTPELEPVERIFAVPQASATLTKLTKGLAKQWNSPKHRQAISAMLDKLKGALKFKSTPSTDEAWERLIGSCTDYCCAAIHAEAGEEAL